MLLSLVYSSHTYLHMQMRGPHGSTVCLSTQGSLTLMPLHRGPPQPREEESRCAL